MNFLLIMPRITSKVGDSYQFPLGLPYVSAVLKDKFNIITCNLNHRYGTVEDVLAAEIEKHNIDVVMTGGLSFQFWPVYQIVQCAKKINKKLLTIVGGG